MNEPVKLRVRLQPDEDGEAAFGTETMWATPIAAGDAGGTYRLDNTGFFVPLRVGDVVRAELDSSSMLQLVEVVSLVPGALSSALYPEGTEAAQIGSVVAAWEANGAGQTEGGPGFLVTAWNADLTATEVQALIASSLPATWEAELTPSEERDEWIADVVDLELDRTPPPVIAPTDYWAPDDPEWARRGITDPDSLAYLQTLAQDDPRVLATIKAGRHDDVLTFIERLTAPDMSELPPLDRPLLVDPDEI